MNFAPILERVSAPTSEQVRQARVAAGLTQTQAAQLTSPAQVKPYATWQGYEVDETNPRHRAIPLATWELFLLLTGQHSSLVLRRQPKQAASKEA